jgi:allantoicase
MVATLGEMGTKATEAEIASAEALGSADWTELVPFTPMGAGVEGESKTFVEVPSSEAGKRFTHLRLNLFPDGGIARMKVYGDVQAPIEQLRAKVAGKCVQAARTHAQHPKSANANIQIANWPTRARSVCARAARTRMFVCVCV